MSIGSPAMGYEEAAGFGKETTYGAFNAIDHWAKPLSFTLKQLDPPLPLAGPSGVGVQFLYDATLPRHFRGTKRVAGNITLEGEYDNIGLYLLNALESPTTTANEDIDAASITGAHRHAFELIANTAGANTPPSLSIGRLTGMEDLRFLGCMIDTLEISANADSIVTVSMDIIGQSGGDAEVDDADTEGYSAAPFIEFHDSCFSYNATVGTSYTSLASGSTQSGGAAPLSWSFRLENNLRAVAATCLSGRTIREPIYQGYRKAMLTINRDFWDDNFFDHEFSSTAPGSYAACSVRMTSDEFITGTTPYALDIHFPAGLIMGDPNEYGGGADIESETIVIEAAAQSTSTAPCTVRLANGTSSY